MIINGRKSIRLKNYDYSQPGSYFVTICTKNRDNIFGEIDYNRINLNVFGKIVEEQISWLRMQYEYIDINRYCVMPNHVHLIITINVGNGRDRSLQKIKPLPELIGAFKTTSSRLIHQNGLKSFCWQKSYYDHIIREYIENNPINWQIDQENSIIGYLE
jgi:putative transposase